MLVFPREVSLRQKAHLPRLTLALAALFAASLVGQRAQAQGGAFQTNAPPDRPHVVHGISIPSVAGEPFSATVVIESELDSPDGFVELRRTIGIIARDSKGRTHNETRRLMPESFHGSPALVSVRIFDPESRIRTTLDPVLKIARRQFVPSQAKAASLPNPLLHIEDLGTTLLNGVQARGTRRSYKIDDASSETGEPLQVEDETWYSPDLHLTLLLRHSDPRTGVQTIGVSGFKREDPPASLFDVPQSYRVLDLPPAAPGQPMTPPIGEQPEEPSS